MNPTQARRLPIHRPVPWALPGLAQLAARLRLVPRPATFARFVSSQSAGAGARSVWLICTSWATPWR